ncbi:hypothetical protein HYQ46_011065 [Verticillium longisporum]|nr:hypothetical protein HYQ46_011065 [Verticillium longisporum]
MMGKSLVTKADSRMATQTSRKPQGVVRVQPWVTMGSFLGYGKRGLGGLGGTATAPPSSLSPETLGSDRRPLSRSPNPALLWALRLRLCTGGDVGEGGTREVAAVIGPRALGSSRLRRGGHGVAVPDVNLDAAAAAGQDLPVGLGRALGGQLVALEVRVVAAADEVVCDGPAGVLVGTGRALGVPVEAHEPGFEELALGVPIFVLGQVFLHIGGRQRRGAACPCRHY